MTLPPGLCPPYALYAVDFEMTNERSSTAAHALGADARFCGG